MKYIDNTQFKDYINSLVGKHITFMIYSLDKNDEPILDGNYDTLTGKLVSFENDKLYIDLEVIQDIEIEDLALNHADCLYDIAASEVIEVIYNGLDEEVNNEYHIEDYETLISQLNSLNSVFIYGNNSLKRTYLLQALGNSIRNNNLEKGITYITENNFDSSLEIYQYVDVLIVDDIQNISDKEQLSKILNVLYSKNKQIILGSSKSIEEHNELPNELLTLFIKCESVNINGNE